MCLELFTTLVGLDEKASFAIALLAIAVIALGIAAPMIVTKAIIPAASSLIDTRSYVNVFKELASLLTR